MANDPRTNLFVITKVNGFSKLKGFKNMVTLLANLHNSHS
jgi:hypothetical protein